MLERGFGPAQRGTRLGIGHVLAASLLLACSVEAGGTGEVSDERGSSQPGDAAVTLVDDAASEPEDHDPAPGAADGGVDSTRVDAGGARDAAGADAAVVYEAGPPGADAQAPTDASTASDATSTKDAMPMLDALAPLDAAPLDTGAPLDAQPTPDATTTPDAGPPRCTLEGSYSAEVVLDVQWKGTTLGGVIPVLAAGSGKLSVIARMDSHEVDAGVGDSVFRGCDAVIPDFSASWLIGEMYSVQIPDASWDEPTMPRWNVGWDFACREPGCALRSHAIVATLGARTTSADTWPGRTGAISQIVPVDHDNDGLVGVTLRARGPRERSPSGKAYDEPPISWTLGSRASTLYAAYQLFARVDAKFDSCDAFSGSVSEGRVEARALGCKAHKDGETELFTCNRAQTDFVDENFPHWVVTGGTVRAKRVPAQADCKAVRAVWQR